MMHIVKWQEEGYIDIKDNWEDITRLGTSTLTTNIMHSKGATITIKYSDDMDID